MYNSKTFLNENKFLILLVGLIASITVGLLATKYTIDAPFSSYSNNAIFDIIKVIIMLLISGLIIYTLSFKLSRKLLVILSIAYFLRIAMVFVMSFFGFLPYLYDNNWELDALNLLSDWELGNFHFSINGDTASFYSMITTIVYYLLGYNPIYMQLVNALISTVTIFYFYRIVKSLFNHKIAVYSSLLMALWPTYIYFSSMQMREAMAILFITALIYHFIKWIESFKINDLFFVGVFFILSFLIRSQNAILMILILFPFITYFAWKKSSKYMKVLISFLVFFFISIGVALLIVLGYGEYFSMQYLESEMSYRSGGGSGYLEWMHYSSIFHIILYAPLRFLYFVFSPFPWQISSLEQVLAFFESIVLTYLTFKIFLNYKNIWNYCKNKKSLVFVISFCLLGLTANGLIDSNVGTAIRHKLQYIFIIFFLFGSLKEFKKNKQLLKLHLDSDQDN